MTPPHITRLGGYGSPRRWALPCHCLYNAAQIHIPDLRLRMDWTDKDPDIESYFYLLTHTACPAVLTENMFMDAKADCDFLLSQEGQQALIDLHVTGIKFYLGIR